MILPHAAKYMLEMYILYLFKIIYGTLNEISLENSSCFEIVMGCFIAISDIKIWEY